MIRVVLDGMGGDYAPSEIIKGVGLALEELKDIEIILAGQREKIEEFSAKEKVNLKNPRIKVVDAPEVIEMDEPAAISVKRKKKSSIGVGLELLKEKQAEAFVSCGNTGAVVCASTLKLGLIKGIERAGIGLVFPTLKNLSLIMDVGANIDPKPIHLFQYGLMAEVYLKRILGVSNPKIGLLNIGEEESKGTEFIKETRQLFKEASFNFVGNIEAKDIFRGICDGIICDGFVGNVALKVSEGLAEVLGYFLVEELKKDLLGNVGLLLIKRSLKRFKQIIDYSEYGGAPLLGVNGVVIIGHGRSDAQAVKNALRVALQEVHHNINEEIEKRIDEFS